MKERKRQKPVKARQNGLHALLMLGVATLSFYSDYVFAATSQSIGDIAVQVTSSFGQIAQLITAGSYIAGMGFALGAILKFKQHKDNPQQVPIGGPIALLFIAAALIFLPTIFGIAGQTIFGSGASAGGVTGVSTW